MHMHRVHLSFFLKKSPRHCAIYRRAANSTTMTTPTPSSRRSVYIVMAYVVMAYDTNAKLKEVCVYSYGLYSYGL